MSAIPENPLIPNSLLPKTSVHWTLIIHNLMYARCTSNSNFAPFSPHLDDRLYGIQTESGAQLYTSKEQSVESGMSQPANLVPAMASSSGDLDALRDLCRTRLTSLGVQQATKKSNFLKEKKQRAASHDAIIIRTPGRATGGGGGSSANDLLARIFGRPLRDLSMILHKVEEAVDDEEEQILVPKFLVFLCSWLQQNDRLKTQGIFRWASLRLLRVTL